jgi:hypothetical protein
MSAYVAAAEHDRASIVDTIELLALLATRRERHRDAARLLGAADTERRAIGRVG